MIPSKKYRVKLQKERMFKCKNKTDLREIHLLISESFTKFIIGSYILSFWSAQFLSQILNDHGLLSNVWFVTHVWKCLEKSVFDYQTWNGQNLMIEKQEGLLFTLKFKYPGIFTNTFISYTKLGLLCILGKHVKCKSLMWKELKMTLELVVTLRFWIFD